MHVHDLKFGSYSAKAEVVQAAKVDEDLIVPTAHGAHSAPAGSYVVQVGTVTRTNSGPHDVTDEKTGAVTQVFENRDVEEPAYEVMGAEDFEALYSPGAGKPSKSKTTE